jgi:hypothetical protein
MSVIMATATVKPIILAVGLRCCRVELSWKLFLPPTHSNSASRCSLAPCDKFLAQPSKSRISCKVKGQRIEIRAESKSG